MEYIFDKRLNQETVRTYPMVCELCDGKNDCDAAECPHYEAHKLQTRFTGAVGSVLSAFLSFDLREIAAHIDDFRKTNGLKDYEDDFQQWLADLDFSTFQKREDAVMWELFVPLSGLPYVFKAVWCSKTVGDVIAFYNSTPEEVPIEKLLTEEIAMQSFLRNLRPELYDRDVFLFLCEKLYRTESIYILPKNNIRVMLEETAETAQTVDSLLAAYQRRLAEAAADGADRYEADTLQKFIMQAFLAVIDSGLQFKTCKVCGLPFLPYARSNAQCCDRRCIKDLSKTCKEYNSGTAWYEKKTADRLSKLARTIGNTKSVRASRHPEVPQYAQHLRQYKREQKAWAMEVERGEKTAEEYERWLMEMKEKNY